MLLNAFVILFNSSIFLNVCIYSIYRLLTYSFSYFFVFESRFGQMRLLKKKKKKKTYIKAYFRTE